MCIIRTYERTSEEFKYNFFALLSWKVGVEVNYHWKRIRRFRMWRSPHAHLWNLLGFTMSLSQFRADFLSGLLQPLQSVILAPFILLQLCTFPGWFHFGFVTSQVSFLTFPLHSISGFVSLLLQLHLSFFLTPFCYISITVPQLSFSSVTTPIMTRSGSNKTNFQFLPTRGFGCPCTCSACTFVWLCLNLRCFFLSLTSAFSHSVL